MDRLGSGDWAEQLEALNITRSLSIYHASTTVLLGLHPLVRAVLSVVDNLRSQLSKAAIMSLTDMITNLRVHMDPELDQASPKRHVPSTRAPCHALFIYIRDISFQALHHAQHTAQQFTAQYRPSNNLPRNTVHLSRGPPQAPAPPQCTVPPKKFAEGRHNSTGCAVVGCCGLCPTLL